MVLFGKDTQRIYVGKRSFELSLNLDIISFNDGFQGIIKALKILGVNTGRFMKDAIMLHDALGISIRNHKSTNKCKIKRQKLRGIKKGFLDKEAEEPLFTKFFK